MIEARISRFLAMFVVLVAFWGCARSQPANYYILHSILPPGSGVANTATEHDPAIGVGPVKIPQYLDRPEIATRITQTNLQFAEFDKWAESLEKSLTRVIADNLSAMLPSDRVSTYPWPNSVPVQYQITLEIIHLEKIPGEKVFLDASWNILGDNGEKLLVMNRSRVILPVESAGFEAIAKAESRAVEDLSREIATAVKALQR